MAAQGGTRAGRRPHPVAGHPGGRPRRQPARNPRRRPGVGGPVRSPAGAGDPARADLGRRHRPELALRLRTELVEPRRDRSATVLRRAVTRGVLPPDTDVLTLLDLWAGLMLFRGVVLSGGVDDRTVRALVTAALDSPPRLP
ncbi:TetR-like C-terminal domain-containing protein [Kitasatospora cheerisanensis]|uniref:TetR-like C-terminal domain-containing protein n=1 Tax=Kitasatospora cheerisanensis TaxID=81942 RepID=UPI00313436AC